MCSLQNYPGPIVLFGSGETSPSGQKIFDRLFQQLPKNPKVALLETPAGFELNSAEVAGRVANFFRLHLQNYNPDVDIIPARKRGTRYGTDDESIAAPLLQSDLIFAGPGSPTYAVRQLCKSLTCYYLMARHRLGAALAFSSSAVIALSTKALPVYEIFKVGEDPHWKLGLDFFAPFMGVPGVPLIFIPHWNNKDGGHELDTSRCFMGRVRFEFLLGMLPKERTIMGIDEHTALWMDCAGLCCEVFGLGTVTLIKGRTLEIYKKGDTFPLRDLMSCQIPDPSEGIPQTVWQTARRAVETGLEGDPVPPAQIQSLLDERKSARSRKDWAAADKFRDRIAALGWYVKDTPEGPVISKL